MGDLRLYKHSHIGTKALIERYIESAKETLKTLIDLCDKQKDAAEKKHVLDELLLARQAFGRSALLLSGGGTFGMNHIGVIKTLWEHKMLPRIVSGSSAGSIVCSVLATRTDAQIPDVMEEFCYGELDVFEKEGEEESILRKAARFLKYGAVFDIQHLVRVMKNLLGDLTFQEAYNRTRRILNISVSSAGIHELPRLLNYITAPNVIIWSAVAASCSVPLVFSPASLLAKDPKTGDQVPWNPSPQRWIDGSVDSDLPMTRLAEMFNVNHFIVSQVNPHVVPFLVKEEDRIATEAELSTPTQAAGSSWFHTMAGLAKGEALHRMHVLTELGIFPTYFTKVRSVLSQRYSGDITILPEISYAHFPRVLQNPTTDFMLEAMLSGERASWPKLSRIQNHCAIELALDDAVQQLRARIVFSRSQIDLRLDTLNINVGHRSNHDRRGRTKRPGYSYHRPSRSIEPESSHSPPQRPRSYFEVRPRRATPHALHLQNPLGRQYPSSPALKVAATDLLSSSADDDHADLNPFTDDTDGSVESYSSDSPPPSPLPELWPSTRQLFPSASQPVTPFFSSRLAASNTALPAVSTPHPTAFGHGRNEGTAGLTMTPATPSNSSNLPSSPETRYKQLFHNGSSTTSNLVKETSTSAGAENASVNHHQQSSTQHHGRRTSGRMSVGSDAMDTDDYDDTIAVPTAGSKKRPGSRRGSVVPLVLDISGTRGMMLRRQRSLSSGSGIRGLNVSVGPSPTTKSTPVL
jgi:TAG lipase / steryl ester hydrolase / phospholipase A2 / LPA acyltransferase